MSGKRKVGRPKNMGNRLQMVLYLAQYKQGKMTEKEICNKLGISLNTFRNYQRRCLLEERLREIGLDEEQIESLQLDDIIW